MKVIVYSRPDGGVSVCNPAPQRLKELMDGGMTEDEAIAVIQLKSVPSNAANIEVMEQSLIPGSREFRNAWEKPGAGPPTINMPKARGIHAEHIATARTTALVVLEKRENHERLKGNTAAADKAASDRTAVAGINLTAEANRISGAANPTALSAIWPAALDGFRK